METQDIVTQFYQGILGISSTWKVVKVEKDGKAKEIHISLEYGGEQYRRPVCGAPAKRHDCRIRELRHLDTCDYKTILEVRVPRVKCPEHKVQQMPLEFAEKHSLYTGMFEMLVILCLEDEPVSAAAEKLDMSWGAIDGIMQRGVVRGLRRRDISKPHKIGIDETAYRKGHDYVTVILDKDRDKVLAVLADRKAETVSEWFKTQKICDFSELESISMDMSDGFIKAVKENFENWEQLICFDRFHVSQHFNKALDKVRTREHREIADEKGKSPLSKSRFGWLVNGNLADNREKKRRAFKALTKMHLRTARAWRMKETAATLWDYCYMGVAENNWKSLLSWMMRSRIEEMKKVAGTVRNYFWGILNAIRLKTSNGMVEAKNNCIQRIKRIA
jgi:transposase